MSKAKETHLWFEKGDDEIQIESYSKKLNEAILELNKNVPGAVYMHRDFNEGTLTIESMENTLASEKPNQKPMCKVPIEKLQKIAPKVKDKDFEDFVIKACEHYYKYLQRQRSRDRDAR